MSVIPLCTLPVRTHLQFEYNYGSNISGRVKQDLRSGHVKRINGTLFFQKHRKFTFFES